jgi:hypothetical protein
MALVAPSYTSLYNGNIGSMSTKLSLFGNQIRNYAYDQLHRIKEALTLGAASPDRYRENYDFDPNGNITNLKQYNASGLPIDALTYHYEPGKNHLTHMTVSARATPSFQPTKNCLQRKLQFK